MPQEKAETINSRNRRPFVRSGRVRNDRDRRLDPAPVLPKAKRLAETHPSASAVLLEELDAGCLHGTAKLRAGFVRYRGPEPTLNSFHRRKGKPSSRGGVSLRPAQ